MLALALLACACVWTLSGCVSDRPSPSRRPSNARGPVGQLHLLTGPTALNLDHVPGADGFAVRVYASSSKSAATVAITEGKLEILMFDGVLKAQEASVTKPLHVWSYPANELKTFMQRGAVGAVYVLTLPWGESKPSEERISVMARYHPVKGTPIDSGPSTISVAVK